MWRSAGTAFKAREGQVPACACVCEYMRMCVHARTGRRRVRGTRKDIPDGMRSLWLVLTTGPLPPGP